MELKIAPAFEAQIERNRLQLDQIERLTPQSVRELVASDERRTRALVDAWSQLDAAAAVTRLLHGSDGE